MFRNFLLLLVLLGFVTFATAAPITFTEPEYSVTVFAGVDGTTDDADSSSPTSIPLISKSVLTDLDSAFANASAELGKLSASTNVKSTGGKADATSTSRFFGIINDILGGTYRLSFNFITDDPIVGPNPFALSKLAVTIASGLDILYNQEFISTTSLTDIIFPLTPGFTGLFDITLISSANSTSGNASNAANVDFSINAVVNGVPEPHEGMLLLLGGLAMYNIFARDAIVQAAISC